MISARPGSGIAVSDRSGRVAMPVKVMNADEVINLARPFRMLLEDYEPELLVCGLPQTMAGEEGPQAERIKGVAQKALRCHWTARSIC